MESHRLGKLPRQTSATAVCSGLPWNILPDETGESGYAVGIRNLLGPMAVNHDKHSDWDRPMRSSYLLPILPLLLLGCSIPDDDQGYGVRGPAALERERQNRVSDLRRTCREGDRPSCDALNREMERQRREERYEGPQPSLSERNRDQQRGDQERHEERLRRQQQRFDPLGRP